MRTVARVRAITINLGSARARTLCSDNCGFRIQNLSSLVPLPPSLPPVPAVALTRLYLAAVAAAAAATVTAGIPFSIRTRTVNCNDERAPRLDCLVDTVYVDVDGRDNETITLNFRLSDELQSRMWEMRVAQLGFEQRAPAGCLQYFLSPNGTLRTFNYLPNGRYLAGHDYLLCVRQERDMCGIAYRPCTRDSFRIGPGPPPAATSNATSVVTPMSQTPQTPQTVAAANAATVSAVEPPTSVAPAPSMSPAPPPTSVDEADAADVVEGSGAAAEREMREWFNPGGATLPSPYERRCGDRVLIPCDFEEFITVSFAPRSLRSLEIAPGSEFNSSQDSNARLFALTQSVNGKISQDALHFDEFSRKETPSSRLLRERAEVCRQTKEKQVSRLSSVQREYLPYTPGRHRP